MARRIERFSWHWAGWAKPGNEDANRAQREWLNEPETRKRLDSGELSIGGGGGGDSEPERGPTADQIYDDMMRAQAQGSKEDLGLVTSDV